jgi:hypothetical protein
MRYQGYARWQWSRPVKAGRSGVGGTLIQCLNGMWDQQMRAAW